MALQRRNITVDPSWWLISVPRKPWDVTVGLPCPRWICQAIHNRQVPRKRDRRFTVLAGYRAVNCGTCTTYCTRIDTEDIRSSFTVCSWKNADLAWYGRFYRQNYYGSIIFTVYSLMYCIIPKYFSCCPVNIYLKLLRPLFPRSRAGNRRRNVKCSAVAPISSALGVAHRPRGGRLGSAHFYPYVWRKNEIETVSPQASTQIPVSFVFRRRQKQFSGLQWVFFAVRIP